MNKNPMDYAAVFIAILVFIGPFLGLLFVVMRLIYKAKHDVDRLESWSQRDQELSDAFFRALECGDYKEAKRIQYAITKNYQGFKESE